MKEPTTSRNASDQKTGASAQFLVQLEQVGRVVESFGIKTIAQENYTKLLFLKWPDVAPRT